MADEEEPLRSDTLDTVDSFPGKGGALADAEAETRPTFAGLKSIERRRRELLLRTQVSFWRILLSWSGTCLKEISTDLITWVSLASYIGVRVAAEVTDYVPDVAFLEKTNISILGGFFSFLLVMFINQTNGRFLEMYGFSRACAGRIQDVAGLARAQLPPELGRRLVRHFNAAQIAGYVGMNSVGQGGPYSKAHFFDVYNERHRLLTPAEMKQLDRHDMNNSGLCMKELCTWCQLDVAEALRSGHINFYQEQFMQDRILAFRAAMDGMYDYVDQPPHFFYIHFLVLLGALYLPLFAMTTAHASGWGEDTSIRVDVLNGLIVLIQCIFVVGLLSLGKKMIDPYREELEDLSVILYVEVSLEICDTIMSSSLPPGGAAEHS